MKMSWPKATKFFDLGDLEISPDERWMAYTVDLKGDEKYGLFVKDLQNRSRPTKKR